MIRNRNNWAGPPNQKATTTPQNGQQIQQTTQTNPERKRRECIITMNNSNRTFKGTVPVHSSSEPTQNSGLAYYHRYVKTVTGLESSGPKSMNTISFTDLIALVVVVKFLKTVTTKRSQTETGKRGIIKMSLNDRHKQLNKNGTLQMRIINFLLGDIEEAIAEGNRKYGYGEPGYIGADGYFCSLPVGAILPE